MASATPSTSSPQNSVSSLLSSHTTSSAPSEPPPIIDAVATFARKPPPQFDYQVMDKAFTTAFSMSVMEGLVERLLPKHRKDIYEAGFGFLLHLPQSAGEKLSRKFHCWLLCNIDAATRTICDGQGSSLQLT
jgi:hypothetical protein